MANKRVSELASITAPDLNFADLLLISDISRHESMKLQLSDLNSFLLMNGRLTGSLLGTASYAITCGSASYAPFISASYANTSSWSRNAITASAINFVTLTSKSASWASASLSASYSRTASYLVNGVISMSNGWSTINVNGVISSDSSINSTRGFALITALPPPFMVTSIVIDNNQNINGRSIFATAGFTGSLQGSSSYTTTTSTLRNTTMSIDAQGNIDGGSVGGSISISGIIANDLVQLGNDGTIHAGHGYFESDAWGNVNARSITSSLQGTASYALVAGSTQNVIHDYGMFLATSQSISSSQIDLLAVTPTFGGLKTTNVEAYGTVIVSFTSSASPTDGVVELVIVDRQYGYTHSLDASPICANMGGSSTISGTLKYPFTLRGEADLSGLYAVYVTASQGVFIEPSRTARFQFTSESDQILVSSAEPMIFYSSPNNVIMSWSSSLHPADVYFGSSSQVIFSGSNDVTELLVYPSTVNTLQYTWTLGSATKIIVDNNPGLTYLGGIPSGCITMSAANCGLTELPLMANSSIGYLNVPNNTIIAILSLPASMSYLDISNNFYVALPFFMPSGMQVLKADGTGITSTPYGLSDNLISMSFANCPRLTSWLSPAFPSSLKYFDANNSPLTNTPFTMPTGLVYVNVEACSMGATVIGNIVSGLVFNAQNDGYLNILNNPASESAFNINANITTLRNTYGWTVVS